jgi:hypothetical protein
MFWIRAFSLRLRGDKGGRLAAFQCFSVSAFSSHPFYRIKSIFSIAERPPAFTFAKYTPEASADPSNTCR